MEHVGIRRILATLFCTALIVPSICNARLTTQTDINDIADNLGITLEVKANHDPDRNFTVAFILANRRSSGPKMLDTDDWLITFCLNDAEIFTKPEFAVKNIAIKALADNFYTISPTGFIGLGPKNAFKITIQAYGLSAFRYDFQPSFIISSTNTAAKTIKSTTDTNLRFVKLVNTNNENDPTRPTLSPLDRFLGYTPVEDLHRVPESFVIPRPRENAIQPPLNVLINLTESSKFYFNSSSTVSESFKTLFTEMFAKIDGVTPEKMMIGRPYREDGDVVTLEITGDRTQPRSYYEVEVEHMFYNRQYNKIRLSGATEEGLHYAMETFKGILGLYGILPHKFIVRDQGRFDFRSITLDLTKHVFDKATLKKFIDLMSMYKLNKLILNLGDTFGWRLQIPGMEELTTIGAKRCHDQTRCIPPFFDAGAEGTAATNSFFRTSDFAELLIYAKTRKIDIIPKFNFFGGLLSAKRAAHGRYERLIGTDPAAAHKFHLDQNGPLVSNKPFKDGLLNHCDDTSITFMKHVIREVNQIYATANVRLTGFHVGGDDLTKYVKEFPACQQRFTSTADVLRNTLAELRGYLNTLGNEIWLHTNEEVITDPATGDSLAEIPGRFGPSGIVVHFKKTYVDNLDDLTPQQLEFLRRPQSLPTPNNPMATPDPLVDYRGPKINSAQWLLPYKCANRGFKIVLEPENFYALDQAYELDFNEPGRRKKDAMHIISLHRMITFEPNNLYVNLGVTRDGKNVLNYRMCKIANCEPLGLKENLIGIGATIDTQNIRNAKMLWYMMLPRMLMFAEKAWIRGENEDLLRAEVPRLFIDQALHLNRSRFVGFETHLFVNTLSHKEMGRLEVANYTYRMPKIGARIVLGLNSGALPPYVLEVNSDVPLTDLQFLEIHKPKPTWNSLFTFNPRTTEMMGGYAFSFPVSNQEIYIRQRSPEGTRTGPATYMNGSIDFYLPQTIPTDLRGGACLSIYNGSETDISTVTEKQWLKVLENIDTAGLDLHNFRNNRTAELTQFVAEFNRNNSLTTNGYRFPDLERLDFLANTGSRISDMDNLLLRTAFEKDRKIYEERMAFVQRRYDLWELQYQSCLKGQYDITLKNPNVQYPPGGPLPHVSTIPVDMMGPGGPQMGPPGQQMVPPGQQMVPPGQQMGQGGVMSQGGSQMGQGRSQIGQGGSQLGQGGPSPQQGVGRFQNNQQGGTRQQGGFNRPQQPGFARQPVGPVSLPGAGRGAGTGSGRG
ncbi:hypothetical protein ACF0H5_015743 [Mactra antiquata]